MLAALVGLTCLGRGTFLEGAAALVSRGGGEAVHLGEGGCCGDGGGVSWVRVGVGFMESEFCISAMGLVLWVGLWGLTRLCRGGLGTLVGEGVCVWWVGVAGLVDEG